MKRIKNIAFGLYFPLILSFCLGVIIRITPVANLNLYPQDIFASLLFPLVIIKLFKNKNSKYKKIFTSILIFNLVAIISLTVNSSYLAINELVIAAAYLARLNIYFSLLFIELFEFENKKINVLKKALIVSSTLVVIFGIIQYFFYNNLRNLYYLGWDEHLYRLFSTFLDPNFVGLFFAIFSIFIIGKLFSLRDKFNIQFYTYIFLLLLTSVSLLLTYSRTALVSLLVGLVVLMVTLKKIKLLILLTFLFILGIIIVSDFSIEGMNPLRIASSEARVESMNQAIEIFSENPILGVGFNAYRYAQIDKGFRSAELTKNSNADAGTDNSFLFVLATAGIVGFFAYLNIWKNIILAINSKDRYIKIFAITIIISLFIGSLFINALFYIPILSWVFIYMGLFVFNKD